MWNCIYLIEKTPFINACRALQMKTFGMVTIVEIYLKVF